MTMSVEERLARAAGVLDEQIEQCTAGPAYEAGRRERRRHRLPVGIATVAAAVALVVAGVVAIDGGDETDVAVLAPPPGQPGPDSWELLPDAPIAGRFQHMAVSTGDGLLVWGGYNGDGAPRTDGAFFDAVSRTWRELPEAPLAGDRGDAVGAWTGAEIVVVNGIHGNVKAAAFDPAAFSWRPLPDPPLTNAANMMTRAVAIGRDVVVITVADEGDGGARNEIALFEAASGSWLIGEPPPGSFGSGFDAVAFGDEVVVVGRRGFGGSSCGRPVVAAYRPGTNSWRELPAGPAAERHGQAVSSTDAGVVVAGGYICGDDTPNPEAHLLDVVTGEWRQVATAPTGLVGSDRYSEPSSEQLVAATGADSRLVLYDAVADRWHVGPASPLGHRYTETPWTWVAGKVTAFSGGLADDDGGCCDPVDGGYRYTPPGGW